MLIVFYLLELVPYQQLVRSYSFDLYQNLFPRERISAPVIIADIDEASLAAYGQWPWPRSLLARLVNQIGQQRPAAIALDIIMPEKDRASPCELTRFIPEVDQQLRSRVCSLPSNDALLASALADNNAVLGVAGIDNGDASGIRPAPVIIQGPEPKPHLIHFNAALTNIAELQQAAAGQAILSTEVERGVIRRVPLIASVGDTILPSLSLETLRVALGQSAFSIISDEHGIQAVAIADLSIPTQADGTVHVHYSQHEPARFVSAMDILNGHIEADLLQQRLVLIGFSGLGLVDFPTTAIGERVPGVEIHAQLLESIFDGTTLLRPDWAKWAEALIILLLGLSVIFLLPGLRAAIQVSLTLLIATTMTFAGFYAYQQYFLLLDISWPLLIFATLYMAMLADVLIRDESQIEVLEDDLRLQREEAAKVQGEMEAAKRFQMGILPKAESAFEDEPRIDIAAIMEPAKMVGGDLYDFFRLDENHIFFSLGDVCGKGVPASLFMVISKTLCKSVALRENADFMQRGKLISEANKEISRDNPEMLFVTAFMGIINLEDGELIFCNAGHERPLVVAPNCMPRELTEASGPPISIMDDIEYETFTYRLSSEEFICIFTDGVTEAANSEQVLFGKERLTEALSEVSSADNAQSLLNRACESVHEFVGDEEPSDDLTMLVVRWQGNHRNLR
ncbi:MAG: CHASE2 domain-containing protein [Methylophaga sp.]|nr:CHASE2 domain-containing protein [Methylophaga sp.]